MEQVEPSTERGRFLQNMLNLYCLGLLAYSICKMFVPGDSGFVDLLAAIVLFFANNKMSHFFVAWLILITFSSLISMFSTLGLHVQTGVSMFGDVFMYRTIVYLLGFVLYSAGIDSLFGV